jgi:hypothetical protein
MAGLMRMSIANCLVAAMVASFAHGQTDRPAEVLRALRDLARGAAPMEGVRVETECRDGGRFVTARVHGGGAAIWNDERQGTAAPARIRALVGALAREGFARMPGSFGEERQKDDERPKPKLTCLVRFAGSGVRKTVLQFEEGPQSPALQRLASAVMGVARSVAARGVSAASLDEGLAAVADGRLAVETLRVTVRVGIAGGPGGRVVRLDGRDLEIEPDAAPVRARRLDEPGARAIARTLRAYGFASLPPNVRSDGYTDVTVAVLGHEHGVQARPFGGAATQDPAIAARLRDAIAPLLALR